MTLSIESHAGERRIDTGLICALGAGVLVMALASLDLRLLNDGDTFWHIRAGEWMLDHRQIPHTDIFSYTRAGAPWATHEWLAEIAFALSYRAAGFAGVLALTALTIGAASAILAHHLLRRLAPVAALAALAIALSCAAPNLLARPHVLALPVMMAWTAALFDARRAKRAPPFVLLPLMTLWANLHGGFAFGIALIAPLALEALMDKADRAQMIRWALFTLGAVTAALLTPSGLDGLLFPFHLTSISALSQVGEWRPPVFSAFDPMEGALAVALIVIVRRGVTMPLPRVLLLLALLHMGLTHVRYELMFGLIGAVALADPFVATMPRRPARTMDFLWAPVLACVVVAITVLRLHAPVIAPERLTNPARAIAAIPDSLRGQPMFNAYSFGGALIFAGLRPYVDSRVDVFGNDFLNDYSAIADGDRAAMTRAFSARNIQWTILEAGSPLAAALDHTPGWRRLYADDIAVIQVKDVAGLRLSSTP